MAFIFIIFILLGLIAILSPIFSEDLKKTSGFQKVLAFGFIMTIGAVFVSIGVYNIYDSYFKVYPSIEIKKYAIYIFDDYNKIKEAYEGEQVIDIKNESYIDDCDEEYCRRRDYHYLFEAADLDSNKMVTSTELYNLIKTFDTNQDGLLNTPGPTIKTLFTQPIDSETNIFNDACPLVHGNGFRNPL